MLTGPNSTSVAVWTPRVLAAAIRLYSTGATEFPVKTSAGFVPAPRPSRRRAPQSEGWASISRFCCGSARSNQRTQWVPCALTAS